jgi:hypothetical protein
MFADYIAAKFPDNGNPHRTSGAALHRATGKICIGIRFEGVPK